MRKLQTTKPDLTKALNTQIVIESIGKDTDKTFRSLARIKKIKSNEEYNMVASQVKALKNFKKAAKSEEQKLIGPIERWIEKHFSPFYKKVDATEKEMKALMDDFRASNKDKLLKLEEAVSSGKIKNISVYVAKAAELSIESEDSSVRRRWVATIVDENKIPRKFLQPNASAINAHLREGGKPIPGVKWEQVESTSI